MTIFFRLLEPDDKGAALHEAIAQLATGTPNAITFPVEPASFQQVPGSPFAYWVSEEIRKKFSELKCFANSGKATQGLATADDFRFLRLSWEIQISKFDFSLKEKWVSFAKGGEYSLFYTLQHLVINWFSDGAELKAWAETLPGTTHWSRRIASADCYFRAGLTYPRRTNGLSVRVMPQGCIFADKGPAIFVKDDEPDELMALCAVMNSRPFNILVSVQLARTELAQSFEVGLIQQTPVPDLTPESTATLATFARRAWSLKRHLDTVTQTSHAFILPALLQVSGSSLSARATIWTARVTAIETELAQIQSQIDAIVFDLYGISDQCTVTSDQQENRSSGQWTVDSDQQEKQKSGQWSMTSDQKKPPTTDHRPLTTDPPTDHRPLTTLPTDDEEEEEGTIAALPTLTRELLGYLLSVAIGRFDVRLATGDKPQPAEPEPFDPLPICSPGMLVDANSLPLTIHCPLPTAYPLQIPFNGILVDDEGHPHDIIRHVHDVLKIIWGDQDSDIEQETCELLKVNSLHDYFRKFFFADHLSRYSKSRRQAPIYLPLSTRSGSYTLWLYYHRLTDQTLYTCINDYVEPKLGRISETVNALRGKTGRSRDEEDDLEDLQTLEDELTKFRDELLHVAKLPWKPNLNDGVQITVAPLYSLFRLGKWQKKLKETWDKLAKGDYDWAHLAYSLWTERVREKCRTDKSLAIAHNLEDLYEPPPETPKRAKRKKKE